MDPTAPPNQAELVAGEAGAYLIDPIHLPIAVGQIEQRVLKRIDGRRNLKAILSKTPDAAYSRLIHFLMRLISQELVVVRKKP